VRECRVIPVYSLLLVCVLTTTKCTRTRGATASGVPHALFGRKIINASGASRCEVANVRLDVIASEAKQSTLSLRLDGCFASLAMTVYN